MKDQSVIPQDFKNTSMVYLHKRDISLLSKAHKIPAKLLLNRLTQLTLNGVTSQRDIEACAGRGMVAMVFMTIARQLQDKYQFKNKVGAPKSPL